LLDGHKTRKKRLVPPLNDFAELQFVSTLDSILPEVLWIGGAIENYGLRDAITIVSNFLQALWSKSNPSPPEYFRNSVLANPENREIVTGASGFAELEPVFRDLASFYGGDWMPPISGADETDAVNPIPRWVAQYWNRYEQPFLLVGATIIYSLGVADRMKFAPGLKPNLEALAEGTESAESKMAAAFVRSSLMAVFPQSTDEHAARWCRRFWEVNYRSSECEFDV
jgi:hypothetical protein